MGKGNNYPEAMFYTSSANGVKCMLCPRECNIADGKISSCHTRLNRNGKLITMAWNNPCAAHTDPIEKKPLYHFLPCTKTFSISTAGCNLHCLNCQNDSISQVGPADTPNMELTPEQVVKMAISQGCHSIAYTYTDPVAFYEYMTAIAIEASKSNLKNIMVTSGYINEKPLRELCKHIHAANVDLKSFSNSAYQKLNAATLEPVLNTLKILKEEGVWLEITYLIIPGWNDSAEMISEMCGWLANNGFADVPLHFSRFHPAYKLIDLPSTPVATLEMAREKAPKSGINYVYIGNLPGRENSDTICPACKKLLISRNGYRVTENNIRDGKCGFCTREIPGVWNL